MTSLELSGPAGLAALIIPFAVLVFVIAFTTARINRLARSRKAADVTGRYGSQPAAPPATLIGGVQQPAAPASKAASPPSSGQSLLREIASAEASGDEVRLPQLYLLLGKEELAAARAAEAAPHLTKSIRLAAKLKQRAVHAAARIELGELAHASGDLTTACEHWQIARTILHEDKQMKDFDAVDRRMRQNGCPTDWVLNDF